MRKILLFSLLCLIPPDIYPQPTGWFWANPQPSGNYLTDVQFLENTVYACGGTGTILKSTNRGYSWSLLNSYTTKALNDLNFINAETGYAAGQNIIIKTTNGGASWYPVFNNYRFILGIDIVSSSLLFANNGKTVFRSSDAGNIWDSIASNFSPNQNYTIHSIDFLDANTGFAAGNPDILMRTTNGGLNWESQAPQSYNRNFYSIAFSNGVGLLTYYGLANGIKRTTNYGNNWTCILCDSGSYIPKEKLYFNNPVAVVTGNKLYYSTNAGITWNARNNPANTTYDIDNCALDDSNNVYLIKTSSYPTSASEIFKTTNFGTNWTTFSHLYTNASVSSLLFIDSSTVFAGTSTSSYPYWSRGMILRTTNAGITWDTTYRDSSQVTNINTLLRVNNAVYFAFGDNGISIKSINGGNSWTRMNITTAGFTKAVYINNTIFASSITGRIFKSTDLGATWDNDTIINGNSIRSMYFANSNTGYLIEGPRVWRTTDAGSSWQPTFTGTNGLLDIAFFDASTGLMTDNLKRIYRSTNSGNNWQIMSDGPGFNALSIINNTAYSAGDTGKIYKTTDRGITWTLQRVITNRTLRSASFLNESIGAVGGDAGTIILTYNGSTVGISGNSTVIENYHLKQNYPNPFNPTTKIQFAIPKNGIVTLKVYDMLGREVSTLVSTHLSMGTHVFDFNGANLTSGVYFYRLDVQGQFTETKKMLLVK